MHRRNPESMEEYIEECNRLALKKMISEKFSQAIMFLNQALFTLRLLPNSGKTNSLTAVTYNNLGCFYKRVGELDKSLGYFFRSLDLEKRNIEMIANTNLNISVILSLQSDHQRALNYALKALALLKQELKHNSNLIFSIINCYSRIGIEYKALGQLTLALQCFKKGFDICAKLKRTTAATLRHKFKLLYIKCLSEIDEKRPENSMYVKKNNRKSSYSPKSTIDTHSTILSQQTAYKPQPYQLIKPMTCFTKREVLPAAEEFHYADAHLGRIYENNEKKRIINVEKHKTQERIAATLIQAHLRGFLQRKRYFNLMLKERIRLAEEKARLAFEEVKQLKTIEKNQRAFMKIRKQK